MHPVHDWQSLMTRRSLLGRTATGLGWTALVSLLQRDSRADPLTGQARDGSLRALHHTAKAKRVIYLVMSGGPSHIDLFDYKPALQRMNELLA